MPGGAIFGAGLVSGGASLLAAGMQSDAAQQAIAAQQAMFNQAKGFAQPFLNAGTDAWKMLAPLLGIGGPSVADGGATGPGNGPGATDIYGNPVQSGFGTLTNPFQPTQAQLEQTPGYQFTLGQGEKAVTNSNAAKGLGSSGAALKGAADYATGLASNTFQQQYQDYTGQQQQIYNMLYQPTQLGAGAAASLGGLATGTGQGIANALGYMGNAQAAGINGAANNLAGGLLYGTMVNQNANQPAAQNGASSIQYPFGGVNNAWGTGSSVPYANGGVIPNSYYQPFGGV